MQQTLHDTSRSEIEVPQIYDFHSKKDTGDKQEEIIYNKKPIKKSNNKKYNNNNLRVSHHGETTQRRIHLGNLSL